MASVGNIQFYNNESLTAGAATSPSQSTELHQLDFIAMLKLENAVGANVSGNIEHSPDGVNWEVLVALGALTADGISSVEVTGFVYPKIRAALTVAGAADVSCYLWFDKRGK